jgi:hypothetical protein
MENSKNSRKNNGYPWKYFQRMMLVYDKLVVVVNGSKQHLAVQVVTCSPQSFAWYKLVEETS